MFKYNGQTYCIREINKMMKEAQQYAQTHCWCCDKEFQMGEQIVTIPVQDGLYCRECAESLMKVLVIDSEETVVKDSEEQKDNT